MDRYQNRWRSWLQRRLVGGADRWLIILPAVLLVFGLLSLSSASSVVAYQQYQDSYHFVKRQAIAVLLGIGCLLLMANVPLKALKKIAAPGLAMIFISLIAVVVFGKTVNGSTAWFTLFGFSIQPSEFLKPILLLYLAAKLNEDHGRDNWGKVLTMLAVAAGLMIWQRDVGTLFVISIASAAVLVAAGVAWKRLALLAAVGLIGFGGLIMINSHQQERFRCLFDAAYSPRDKCYQINQSLIAVGSGGLLGRGFGESRQKFLYLPEVQNDFIFAVISEEMGVIIAGAILVLFGLLFYRAYLAAKASNDPFAGNLAIGLAAWLFFQAVLNIGGITRLLPMTGVPLPFISYGGSAMLASLLAIGLLINISRQR